MSKVFHGNKPNERCSIAEQTRSHAEHDGPAQVCEFKCREYYAHGHILSGNEIPLQHEFPKTNAWRIERGQSDNVTVNQKDAIGKCDQNDTAG